MIVAMNKAKRRDAATTVSIFELDPSLKPLVNDFCFEASWSKLLNVSFSMGNPRLEILREPIKFEGDKRKKSLIRRCSTRLVVVKGEWNIIIWSLNWRVFRDGACIARSGASCTTYKKCIAVYGLKGQRLVQIQISKENGTTRFEFDLDSVLEVRRSKYRTIQNLWTLSDASGDIWVMSSDGTLQREIYGQ